MNTTPLHDPAAAMRQVAELLDDYPLPTKWSSVGATLSDDGTIEVEIHGLGIPETEKLAELVTAGEDDTAHVQRDGYGHPTYITVRRRGVEIHHYR